MSQQPKQTPPQTGQEATAPESATPVHVYDGTPATERRKRQRKVSANELLRRRIAEWEEADPSSLLTRRIEKVTAPLQTLVSLLLPDTLVREALSKTLRAAELLTDRGDVYKSLNAGSLQEVRQIKVDQCDLVGDQIQFWAVGAAAALGAWDLAGPLGIAPALASLMTLSFRTIKKIGLSFGYDTSSAKEELIVLEIFAAASSLYHRDKVQALKSIEQIEAGESSVNLAQGDEAISKVIEKISGMVTENLKRRRSLATIPAMGVLVGSSSNAWLLKDVAVAARNIYALRRLNEAKAARDQQRALRGKIPETMGGEGLPEAA